MKISAPVRSIQEVEMLLHNGADELYCGISTPEWKSFFNNKWWMNRREPTSASFESLRNLKETVRLAHLENVPVHLALNAPFYPKASIPYLLTLSEKLVQQIKVDSLIVSDLNFIMHLSSKKLPVRLHLSSLGSCFNSRTVEFYKSMGVQRIILPRQLRASEIRELIERSTTSMEFEVFAVNDGCLYEEGFCQVSHAFGPFCLENCRISINHSRKIGASLEKITDRQEHLQQYLWFQNNCGSSYQETGLPNGPCSLCLFGYFRDWGVHAVKIVGREASFQRKMGSLQLVKAVMDEVRKKAQPDDIARKARLYRKTPEYCNKGYMCYFREK
jgi:putative protease